jgi:putative phosphoesterase
MRIAVVADIHSNNIAFEAVLKDIDKKMVDRIFFLGDYVFGGYGSNRTVDLLMEYQKNSDKNIIISGNIDELITPIEENAAWIYPVNKQIYNELGTERVEFLKALQNKRVIEVEGVSILLCHNPSELEVFKATDNLRKERNVPDMEALIKIANNMESDVCIFGHYHLFMDEKVNGKRFICPSSVGVPFNGDVRAQYIILEINEGKLMSSKQFIDYDILRLVKEFDESGYIEKHSSWSMSLITTILTAHNYFGTQEIRNS